jgi:hypothetical protein
MKLDHKVFDPIYEACEKGCGDPFTKRINDDFSMGEFHTRLCELFRERTGKSWGRYYSDFQKFVLEAYRSGEIRDAGPYPQKPCTVSFTFTETKCGDYYASVVDDGFDTVVSEPLSADATAKLTGSYGFYVTPWYKLPADVFDAHVDMPDNFSLRTKINNPDLWEIISTTQKTLLGKHPFGSKERGEVLIFLYRAGIIRDKGPMPEKQDYTEAFSVEDGEMRVDWDKIEVTKENALEISIASWEWAYEWMKENGEKVHRAGNECALCQLYMHKLCVGCVVHKDTGRLGCARTPYKQFSKAEDLHEVLDACREEIEFLKSLQ